MTKRKTDKEFKQEVFSLVKDEYTFLEPYQGTMNKIKVRHKTCGNVYEVQPTNFLKGHRCPYCSGNAKKTDKQFKKEVYNLVGDEYTFLDKYVNNHTKINIKHKTCGNVYEVKPNNFINGQRCPFCSVEVQRKTDKQFKQEVYDLVGDEYTFLDKYVNNHTKINVKHKTCGNVYEVTPHNFINGQRCPYCFIEGKRKTDTQFKQEIYSLVGNEYTFLEPYQGATAKIRVKHNTCGNIFEAYPTNFLRGHGCPFCNSPKGETIITKLLDTLNINYEYQKTFPDLKDKSCLSYDFYIPSQSILIEYQGIQHYQPIDYFGGESTFKLQQKHDQMKFGYAREHGYNLIAVPYTVDTFSKIKKYLIKHGLK